MTLTDEMRRLTQRLGEDHNARTAAVVGIRTTVAQNMNEFRANRQVEAEAQRQRMQMYMSELDNQMAKARSDTAALMASLVASRGNMSQQQQGRLAEDLGAMRQSMNSLLDEWNTMRGAISQEQQERLSAHMNGLNEWVVSLRVDVTELRDRLEVAFSNVSKEQQQSLSNYMSELLGQVAQLVKEADQAIAAQRVALQNMASEQRQKLVQANLSLKTEVGAFLAQVGAERQAMVADQVGARELWASYSSMIRQSGASPVQESAQAEPALEKKKVESQVSVKAPVISESPRPIVVEAVTEPNAEDNLRLIQGIGPGMEKRLHAAGIYRFSQVAAMNAQELRTAVEAAAFMKVDSWIEQARVLAG